MEKSKVIKILWDVVKVVLLLGVMALPFYVSVGAGIFSILFMGLGFVLGWNARVNRILNKFFKELLKEKDNILKGKCVTVYVDDATGKVSVAVVDAETEDTKKTKKNPSKKETQEA